MSRKALRRFSPKNGLSWETEFEAHVSKKPEDFLETVLRSHPNPQDLASDEMVRSQFRRTAPDLLNRTGSCELLQMHSSLHRPPKRLMKTVEYNCRARGIHQRQGAVHAKHPRVNCGIETLTPNSLRDSRTSDLTSRPRRIVELLTDRETSPSSRSFLLTSEYKSRRFIHTVN